MHKDTLYIPREETTEEELQKIAGLRQEIDRLTLLGTVAGLEVSRDPPPPKAEVFNSGVETEAAILQRMVDVAENREHRRKAERELNKYLVKQKG